MNKSSVSKPVLINLVLLWLIVIFSAASVLHLKKGGSGNRPGSGQAAVANGKDKGRQAVYAEDYPGNDLGEKINNADKALGDSGGTIIAVTPSTITTPVVLGKRHTLQFEEGIWRIRAKPGIVVDDASSVIGKGVYLTTLILDNGVNGDLIRSRDFEKLTGTQEMVIINNKELRVKDLKNIGGIKYIRIENLTLNGNKANNREAGTGIRIYGLWFNLTNLSIEQFAGDGIVTEFISGGPVRAEQNDAPEAWLTKIKTLGNNGNGWTMRGPHDSIITGLIAANNGGWGIDIQHKEGYYSGGGAMLHNVHAYGNRKGGVRTEAGANILAYGLEAESNHGTGLLLRSNDNLINGMFYSNTLYGVQFGDDHSYSGANVMNIQVHNNAKAQANILKTAGFNHISGTIFAAKGQKYMEGQPSGTDSLLSSMGDLPGSTVTNYLPGGIRTNSEGGVYGVDSVNLKDGTRLENKPRPAK